LQPEFFLDRNLGRRVAEELRQRGWIVHRIADAFPSDAQDVPDEDGIRHGLSHGWVPLSKDGRIKTRDREIEPIRESSAVLYAERWEAETGYADLKIHLSGMRNVLCSTEPNGVAQELYALLIVYQIVQIIRARAARENPEDVPVDPDRISFTITLRALVRSIGRGTPPALLDVFHEIWSSPRLERRGRTKTRERKGTLAYAQTVRTAPLSRAEHKVIIQSPHLTGP